MKKIIPLFIILFWISTTFLLIYRNAPSSGLDTEVQSFLPENKQRWMGIYLKNRKIGFVSSTFSEDIDGYSVQETIHMKLNILGTAQELRNKTTVSLSPEMKVRSFQFKLNASQDVEVTGNINHKTLTLVIHTENSQTQQEILLDEIPQMPVTIVPYLLKKGLRKGTRINIPVFDPVTLSMQKMRVEVLGKEQITIQKKDREAFKIRGDINGLLLYLWIDEQGKALREETPMGFTLVSEQMEDALRIPSSLPDVSDLITQTSVSFNLKLPEDVSYLKVRLKGIDFRGLDINNGRQTLKGDVVEIRRDDLPVSAHVTLPGEDMAQFLRASPFIQSGDPEIVTLAHTIIGKEKNSLRTARLLWEWVYENIEKTPSITLPSAVDVLKTRKGDCNEHTVLYTALARSTGLPTKITVGLVYKDGAFYYHAWPEIFIEKWIAIDPTLGQFPASAAHIKLISGDFEKQIMLLKVINNISLEGLEYG
jgi:hypothetical protein